MSPSSGCSNEKPQASMSVCNLTANIANSIVGFAVLTLPTGMERLSDNGMATSEALGVGVVLLLVFGTLNAWTFTLIAEACERTGVPQPAFSLTFCAIIHSRQPRRRPVPRAFVASHRDLLVYGGVAENARAAYCVAGLVEHAADQLQQCGHLPVHHWRARAHEAVPAFDSPAEKYA